MALVRALRRDTWWLFGERQPELFGRLVSVEKVLVTSAISMHLAFSFCPASWIFSHNLNVLFIHSFNGFCYLQSRIHETWVRLTSSTLEDRLGYRPSDSFETFPFPDELEPLAGLKQIGQAYCEFLRRRRSRRGESASLGLEARTPAGGHGRGPSAKSGTSPRRTRSRASIDPAESESTTARSIMKPAVPTWRWTS